MSLIKVPAVGQFGVNRDLSSHELPINAWTNANNIRFVDGMAGLVLGYKELYASPPVIPYHVLPVDVLGVRTWIYCSDAKMYTVTNGAVHTNITRQTTGVDVNYSAVRNSWTSSVLGGIPILNDGFNVPQMWALSGKAQNLTNWPANNSAKVMRTYKNSLIALNITKTGTNYPYMVKWSHPAVAGAIPSTWDTADATKDAGEFDLSEGYDTIVDGLALRDSFIIYKQSSIWRMDLIGGVKVYRFQKIISNQGALARNCVVEVNNQHFVFSTTDCIVHDGQTAGSVLDKQTRRDLFVQIDSGKADQCFVFVNRINNEVFACYPTSGSSYCNKALVWNYVDKTVSFRDLPDLNHADSGPVDDTSNSTWDSDTDSWDSDTTTWDGTYGSLNRSMVVMASNNQKLYLLDSTNLFDGSRIVSTLERYGLSIGEPESMKLVRSVRPRIYGTGYVWVAVGTADNPYDSPTYSTPVRFKISSGVSVDLMVTSRYVAVKFFTTGDTATYAEGTESVNWRLDSYDLDVQSAGKW